MALYDIRVTIRPWTAPIDIDGQQTFELTKEGETKMEALRKVLDVLYRQAKLITKVHYVREIPQQKRKD